MTSQDQAMGGEVARNLWVRVTRALLAALLMLPFLAAFSQPANAQDADAGVAVVLQVSGLLDPLLADFVVDGIENADAEGAKVVVLQLNSTGSVISNDKLNELADVIADAEVPIAMWVGPSGARATGPWVEIAGLVDRIGVAPGSRIGNSGSERLLDDRFGDLLGAAGVLMQNDTIGADQVIELGIAPNDAPTVGDFVVSLSDLGVEISTRGEGEGARTVSDSVVRFERLSLVAGQLHTVASPPVAYLLFTIGLALLVFEFYTAGVGVAGVVGAGMFLLGVFGLWILPVSAAAIVLIVLAMFSFSVDVQTGVPRYWTIVGALALLVGTVILFKEGVSMSWIPMVVGVVGITMMMVTGMPTMVRTRFSTPTIGREWMIGQVGAALEDVDPDGIVKINEALWKARTNRATPVASGGQVRVVAVEGLILEVEPEEGAARDYRERRSNS
ncbi:MAG: NfeD family protein [Acidimicrobiales bacterium]